MNYSLEDKTKKREPFFKAAKELLVYLKGEGLKILIAMTAVLINSAASIIAPFIMGKAVDTYIIRGDSHNLVKAVAILIVLFLINFFGTYIQIVVMGKVGQNILYKLRNSIFNKLQFLPTEFFNANKSGDLISRVNNDTDKLNQAFSEVLLRFIGSAFVIIGIGVVMLDLNLKLGLFALAATVGIFVITRLLSPWVGVKNKNSLTKIGELSGEVQESLSNFKVIVAFNRRDYFRNKFEEANEENRKAATLATIANGILTPFYDFAGNISTLLVLIIGLSMIAKGQITIGLLISFITYTDRFYQPLRILASLFASIQTSLAAWTRIGKILGMHNNLDIAEKSAKAKSEHLLEFKDVDFGYTKNQHVIKHLSFNLEKGKTYALIGPTGGGKSTTASLMSRLYDPTNGKVLLKGQNIKSYTPEELSNTIGFILQDPFLFSGTVAANIKYGNKELEKLSTEDLKKELEKRGLEKVIERFKEGLETQISSATETISIGQKQLVAFLRSLLRGSEILILDEATANIDTVTENLLQEIINKMPKATTKVVIAHRLNTIKKADEIFFIANGEMQKALSFEDAMKLVNNKEGKS